MSYLLYTATYSFYKIKIDRCSALFAFSYLWNTVLSSLTTVIIIAIKSIKQKQKLRNLALELITAFASDDYNFEWNFFFFNIKEINKKKMRKCDKTIS